MVELDSRSTSSSRKLVLLWRSTSVSTKWNSVGEPSEDRTHGGNSEAHTDACRKYGIFDSIGILVRVMREVMPHHSQFEMALKP
eukprot:7143066-Prorocentrum_lima.AAC.1